MCCSGVGPEELARSTSPSKGSAHSLSTPYPIPVAHHQAGISPSEAAAATAAAAAVAAKSALAAAAELQLPASATATAAGGGGGGGGAAAGVGGVRGAKGVKHVVSFRGMEQHQVLDVAVRKVKALSEPLTGTWKLFCRPDQPSAAVAAEAGLPTPAQQQQQLFCRSNQPVTTAVAVPAKEQQQQQQSWDQDQCIRQQLGHGFNAGGEPEPQERPPLVFTKEDIPGSDETVVPYVTVRDSESKVSSVVGAKGVRAAIGAVLREGKGQEPWRVVQGFALAA
jgi:hypothetical protein